MSFGLILVGIIVIVGGIIGNVLVTIAGTIVVMFNIVKEGTTRPSNRKEEESVLLVLLRILLVVASISSSLASAIHPGDGLAPFH